MVFIILVVLAAALATTLYIRARNHPYEYSGPDYFPVGLAVILSIMVIGVFLLSSAMSWDSDEGETSQADTRTIDIVAMGNSEKISGHYQGGVFASYGYMDSEQVINYVTRDEQGGMHLDRVSANTATVFEQEGDPHIVITKYTEHVDYRLWVPWMVGERKGATHTDLYIPKGSVSNNFSLDPNK